MSGAEFAAAADTVAGPVAHQGVPPAFSGKIVPEIPKFQYDVAIVGSGLSGLTTAYRLRQKGCTAVVIEASNNDIGGRTRSMDIPRVGLVSIGGTWSIFENDDTLSLAKEVNCLPMVPKLVPKLENICHYLYSSPSLLIYLWWKGKKICEQDTKEWWNTPKAQKLDRKSLAEWLHERFLVLPNAVKAVEAWFLLMETFDNKDLSTISALYAAVFLYYRFKGINLFEHGLHLPYTLRWKGGTGVFVYAIVSKIRSMSNPGEFAITKGDPVRNITQLYLAGDLHNPVGVEVTTARGTSYTVRYAVVAANPLATALTIKYRPPLPEQHSDVNQSVSATQNTSLNVILVWPDAWWQQDNEGNVILPDWEKAPGGFYGKGVYGPVMDLSINGKGVLRILTMPLRVEGMSNEEIKKSSLKFLAPYFPRHKNKLKPSEVEQCIVWNWMEEAPELPGVTYSMATGALSSWGSYLTRPFGRVHFGGTERCFHGINWMEGAVQRGNEVANELLRLLGRTPFTREELTRNKPSPNEYERERWEKEAEIPNTLRVGAAGILLKKGTEAEQAYKHAKQLMVKLKADKEKGKQALRETALRANPGAAGAAAAM